MPIIKKAPGIKTREVQARRARQRAARRLCPVHREQRRPRLNAALKKVLWRDQDYRKWREHAARSRSREAATTEREGKGMIQRILHSRGFVSALLAMGTGAFLYYTHPFPAEQIFLRVIAMRAPHAFLSFKYLYYIAPFHHALHGLLDRAFGPLHLHAESPRRISPGRLPRYPDPRKRNDLYLVVGEVHNPRKPGPAEAPRWLTIPERGLFTGIAIFGAVGTGKTSCCMYPFAEQILAYKAADKEKRIGGLILEVKGDFCRKVKDILARHAAGRGLHRNQPRFRIPLQPSSQRPRRLRPRLQHRLASEQSLWPWQGTLLAAGVHEPRQVHHPPSQGRLRLRHPLRCLPVRHLSDASRRSGFTEAEEIVSGRHYVPSRRRSTESAPRTSQAFGFVHDPKEDRYLAPSHARAARRCLQSKAIDCESRSVLDPHKADPEKLEQLEAVKRWFNDDWRRIEPKLRTSIVEGISVFLSLFDDNPKVKRVFCPQEGVLRPRRRTPTISLASPCLRLAG